MRRNNRLTIACIMSSYILIMQWEIEWSLTDQKEIGIAVVYISQLH